MLDLIRRDLVATERSRKTEAECAECDLVSLVRVSRSGATQWCSIWGTWVFVAENNEHLLGRLKILICHPSGTSLRL